MFAGFGVGARPEQSRPSTPGEASPELTPCPQTCLAAVSLHDPLGLAGGRVWEGTSHLGGLWRPGDKPRLRGVWVPFELSSLAVVHTLFVWQVSFLVTCFGEGAGRDGGGAGRYAPSGRHGRYFHHQACHKLFRKGCFHLPAGRPRTVTVPFRSFEPRHIPPSLLREGLDGKVASTGRSAESPGKALNDLLEDAIAKHIWGGGSGAHLPSDPPLLPSGLAGGALQLFCQCCLHFGPEERDRRSSPLRIGFGMCFLCVLCVNSIGWVSRKPVAEQTAA